MNATEKFIALPLAMKVLHHDKQLFQTLKTHRIYENLIDSAIEAMQNDLQQLRYQRVKRMDHTTYLINGELVEYDPTELRRMTSELVREYFYKVKVEFVDKAWIN